MTCRCLQRMGLVVPASRPSALIEHLRMRLTISGLSQRKFAKLRIDNLSGSSRCTAIWYRLYSSKVSGVAWAGTSSV